MDKILNLTVEAKWFDMTLSGIKKEEYREIKNYWFKRLFGYYIKNAANGELANNELCYSTIAHNTDLILKNHVHLPFMAVKFTNGYSSTSRALIAEFKGIEIRGGNEDWGAVHSRKYFVIKLGEIRERINL